jgi:hypothetical protein
MIAALCTRIDWDALATVWRLLGDAMSPLVAPVTAIIAVYIAFQQYRVNRTRVRVELYDRRVSVLRAARALIHANIRAGTADGDALSEYVKAVSEADFLFPNRKVSRYLDELYKKSLRMWTIDQELKGLPVGEKRNERVEEHAGLLMWANEQQAAVAGKFQRYLRVR